MLKGQNRLIKYYGSNLWKEKAIKYGGLTQEEADATSKLLLNNIKRNIIFGNKPSDKDAAAITHIYRNASIPISYETLREDIEPFDFGTLFHEPVHMSTFSLNILNNLATNKNLDRNAISGIAKLIKNTNNLTLEAINNIPKKVLTLPRDTVEYLYKPYEIRARVLAERVMNPLEKILYRTNYMKSTSDYGKEFIDPKIYKKISKEMFSVVPLVGVGATEAINNTTEDNSVN